MRSLKSTFLSLLSPSFFFPLCLFYAFCVMFTDGIVNSYFSLTFLISHAFATAATVSSTSLSSLSISSSVLLPVLRMSQSTMHHERATLSGVLKVRAKFIAKLVLNRRSRDRPRLRPRTALRSNAYEHDNRRVCKKKFSLSFLRSRKFPHA